MSEVEVKNEVVAQIILPSPEASALRMLASKNERSVAAQIRYLIRLAINPPPPPAPGSR